MVGCNERRRIIELDAMKFLAIIFMITVHIFEFNFNPENYNGVVYNLVFFLGGPLAAPAFLFCMGVTIAFSRKREPMDHIKRGFILLMLGYLLNALNGWILMGAEYYAGFPAVSVDDVIDLVFLVDILHLAGMSFMLIGVLEKIHIPHLGMIVLALIMQAVGYALAGVCTDNPVIDGFLGLFIKMEYPESAFPLLNWFIFPVVGILFSDIIRRCSDHRMLYFRILIAFVAIFVIYMALCILFEVDVMQFYLLDSYYNQNILKTFFSLSCVMLELSMLYFLMSWVQSISIGDRVTSIVTKVSCSLTTIYYIQWIIIGNISDYIYGIEYDFEPWLFPVFVVVLVPLCMWMGVKVKEYRDSRAVTS